MNILDIVFPKICVGCGSEGKYICDDCQRKLVRPAQICPICCKPSIDGWTHPKCRYLGGMERLIVGMQYRGMVQDCLKKVKYKSAWEIVGFLVELCKFEIEIPAIITAVPMWREKERSRGFNQAEIITQLVAPRVGGATIKELLLERNRQTRPMFGLNKVDRQINIKGAFKYVGRTIPERVVLVDDVWTTGSTMRECAKILKKAGIIEVWGLTLAR